MHVSAKLAISHVIYDKESACAAVASPIVADYIQRSILGSNTLFNIFLAMSVRTVLINRWKV